MPAFNSLQLLRQLQDQTEGFLQKAIREFQPMPSEQLLRQPGTGQWSAAQCLEHLNSYNRFYLPAIRQAIQTAVEKRQPATPVFRSSWLGHFFTMLMLPKGPEQSVKKMKAPKQHSPASGLNSAAVVAEFIDQQKRLVQLLEQASAIDLRQAKTPVSVSRWLTLPVGDTFRFLIAHQYRHLLQAERALARVPDGIDPAENNQRRSGQRSALAG